MRAVVCSYINPDLDGVACSIALEALDRPEWTACVLGTVDAETSLVLQELGFAVPPPVESWSAVERIWLVDTHHPNQLPSDLPEARVARITDHHPGGDPARYTNAEIQNEPVGAAATLVAERFRALNMTIPPDLALLLQCAIVSNTLNFAASATSARDRTTFEDLKSIKPAEPTLFSKMQRARRAALTGDTGTVLRRDTKTFHTAHGPVVVGQIEAPGALDFLARADLAASLAEMAKATNSASAVINLVDTEAGNSAVLASDGRIAQLISAGLQTPPDAAGVIRMNRLLQRKTDIVPYIITA